MRLALEALEGNTTNPVIDPEQAAIEDQAITALQEALAEQPAQQKPVVFYRCNGCGHAYEQVHPTSCDCMEGSSFEQVNYYTSPPAQQEPVAGVVIRDSLPTLLQDRHIKKTDERLYTSPPAQRTWVGLTDGKTVALIKQCRDAFSEELAAYDIDPPIYHVKQGYDNCVEWLAAHGIKENT